MSDGIEIKLTVDASEFKRALRKAPRRARRLIRSTIKKHANRLAKEAGQELKRIKNPASNLPKKSGGSLADSITTSTVQRRGDEMFCEIKWGKPYGHLLEHGPSTKRWEIKPKNAKVLAFSYWFNPDNTIFTKHVLRIWDKSELRPHVKPASEKIEPGFTNDLARIPKRVLT